MVLPNSTTPRSQEDNHNPYSRIPGNPNFRNQATNAVALVPLLTSSSSSLKNNSASDRSFKLLFQSLERYANAQISSAKKIPKEIGEIDDQMEDVDVDTSISERDISEVLLVVPTAQLTRPGDWRYEKTPLQNFHWGHGCQRLVCFDGRAEHNRRSHDRLLNHLVTREWIDVCPSRRTSAVIGILNLKDIEGIPDGLKRAEAELQRWAERYSTPSYEISAHGRTYARDGVVQRLFVFDSFKEGNEVDLSSSRLGSNLVAFPPADDRHTHMMDLHLNVVVNDLAVAIFRQLEIRIRESDVMAKEKSGWRNFAGNPGSSGKSSRSITRSPQPESAIGGALNNFANTAKRAIRRIPASAPPQLLTSLDSVWDLSEVSAKDADALRRRDVGRREKMAADLSLLAGSPMDAYERYSKAAELAKQTPDPLWYAAALEGCAAAHMSMAEAGGYNVDAYLENNFQFPEEFMSVAHNPSGDSKKTSNPKQTLPAVIYALCEEALLIFNRHVSLGAFHAELLLKLAAYTAVSQEGHMRCRWGEGPGCYGGDSGEPRRWDKAGAANLTFGKLINKDGDDLISLSSLQRTQKFCEFLHRAVNTGSLDPLTRADVAATCARLCLSGLQSTRWKIKNKFNDGYIIRLPRKASFFSSVGAEALSKHTAKDSIKYGGSSLWLAATELYSKNSNTIEDDSKAYGWSTLRAVVLHALSQQEDLAIGEAAAELVLILLSEMSEGLGNNNVSLFEKNYKDDDTVFSRSTIDDDNESIASMSSRRSTISKYSQKQIVQKQNVSSRSNFFHNASQQTLLTVLQAKWAEETAIPLVRLPLMEEESEFALANSLMTLKAVLPKINLESFALAQKYSINQISKLRNGIPIMSGMDRNVNPLALMYTGEMAPIFVESATIVQSASHLLLERTKAHGFSGKTTGVMATFFNPFDKKKQDEKKIAATLVAEGEERAVEIEFNNRLSVPLEIPSCQLVFDKNESDRIKAPSLSFFVPPKARGFKAHFPFIVIAKEKGMEEESKGEKEGNGTVEKEGNETEEKERNETEEKEGNGTEEKDSTKPTAVNVFEVIGIRMTCLSRSFLIPINLKIVKDGEDHLIPLPASVYPRRKHNKSDKKKEGSKPWFEAVPPQPHLHVSFANSQTVIDDGITVPVHLSDGEIFTIPSFRLQNDFGPSGFGLMKRLQIIGVGMPGLSDEVLFDTDAAAAALEEEEDDDDYSDEFEEMEGDGLPPLKMKVMCESLSLRSINDKSLGKGSRVTFQVAATHDMGSQLANGGNVRIRFRYRGISPNPASEIWRKREVALRIVRVKGPRISSLTFRSDLSWGSSYSELCLSLAQQKSRSEMIARKWGTCYNFSESEKSHYDLPNENQTINPSLILQRVGKDQGVHVASDEIVALMAVANETNSTILLSNRKGRVGGFSGSPMPTVRVTSGVSVKIPVVIARIARINTEDDGNMDIAAELVANTALQWKSVVEANSDAALEVDGSSNLKVRQGRVRIPSKCLREIISEHQSFCSRICQSPVIVTVSIGRPDEETHLCVKRGEAITANVEVSIKDWVPEEVINGCSITMEFCCARKNAPGTLKREFVWCGMIRRKVDGSCFADLKHYARVIFLSEGTFVVSACAQISARKGIEETWWAQYAETVIIS